ncbi:hypothetical protein MTBBW1_500002 [Desulfamplus magnetovallimortis]|uniref:Response regulatory domain-containing protein n=1 Tax=Desulfamplus magnetovallimortis TaxID=1246637 RepID=A0A1W1HHG2_9BACT|nr:response regulator transcription factor [Desulfamplus magnetovallimortis]SLM31937.1 hypothetical protein MTBBW1_500002 [Desulfamplus magnetovallimortis]
MDKIAINSHTKHGEHIKILLVEDERVVALSIEESLISLGYTISGNVDSGNAAIESAASNLPDLALMDIRIKGDMDGIDTAMELKRVFDVPVVFLTAYSDQDVLDRAKLVKPLGYLMKPCKSTDLKAVVEISMCKARMDKEVAQLNRDLEKKVRERTQALMDEIESRKGAERKLLEQASVLTESNKMLTTLLENRKTEKKAIEEECLQNIRKYALPYIDIMTQQQDHDDIMTTLGMLRRTLLELISPASSSLSAKYMFLTPREIRVAEFIRHGKTTKEISDLLNLSPASIATYRNHIRKKMNILNTGINLEIYLNSFDR